LSIATTIAIALLNIIDDKQEYTVQECTVLLLAQLTCWPNSFFSTIVIKYQHLFGTNA